MTLAWISFSLFVVVPIVLGDTFVFEVPISNNNVNVKRLSDRLWCDYFVAPTLSSGSPSVSISRKFGVIYIIDKQNAYSATLPSACTLLGSNGTRMYPSKPLPMTLAFKTSYAELVAFDATGWVVRPSSVATFVSSVDATLWKVTAGGVVTVTNLSSGVSASSSSLLLPALARSLKSARAVSTGVWVAGPSFTPTRIPLNLSTAAVLQLAVAPRAYSVLFAEESADGVGTLVLLEGEYQQYVVQYAVDANSILLMTGALALPYYSSAKIVGVSGRSTCPGFCSFVGTCDEDTGECKCFAGVANASLNVDCSRKCDVGYCGEGVCNNNVNDANCLCPLGHERVNRSASSSTSLGDALRGAFSCRRVSPRLRLYPAVGEMRSDDNALVLAFARTYAAERVTLRTGNGTLLLDSLRLFGTARHYVVSPLANGGACRQLTRNDTAPQFAVSLDYLRQGNETRMIDGALVQCEVWRAANIGGRTVCLSATFRTQPLIGKSDDGRSYSAVIPLTITLATGASLRLSALSTSTAAVSASSFDAQNVGSDCNDETLFAKENERVYDPLMPEFEAPVVAATTTQEITGNEPTLAPATEISQGVRLPITLVLSKALHDFVEVQAILLALSNLVGVDSATTFLDPTLSFLEEEGVTSVIVVQVVSGNLWVVDLLRSRLIQGDATIGALGIVAIRDPSQLGEQMTTIESVGLTISTLITTSMSPVSCKLVHIAVIASIFVNC
jgi:hypothetical protein